MEIIKRVWQYTAKPAPHIVTIQRDGYMLVMYYRGALINVPDSWLIIYL
jgi:hypothetical protein